MPTKDYTKILWKIEELWRKYYSPTVTRTIDVSTSYINGVSRYYGRFHRIEVFDFSPSQELVFTDDYGGYFGLDKCQVMNLSGKPVYLFDNHNEMLYPLVEINKVTGVVYDVVHIDAHPDDAGFVDNKPIALSLDTISEFISRTRISDFFDAISESNIISNIYRVTHSDSFEFFLPPEEPYILSLDIDIFGPEGGFCELEDRVRAIALAWSRADAVCIATSPGFIDQKYAQKIIEIFARYA